MAMKRFLTGCGLALALAAGGRVAAADCGGCGADADGGIITIIVEPPPTDAEYRRAGLVPFHGPRDERSLDGLPPPGFSVGDFAAPAPGSPAPAATPDAEAAPSVEKVEAAASAQSAPPVSPRIIQAVHAEAPATTAPLEGIEETPALAAAWRALDWTGRVSLAKVPAPYGGQGQALRVAVAPSDGDGSRTPAEKWGVGLVNPATAGMGGLTVDVLNGLGHPVKLAVGVFVGIGGKRTYYESPPRRLNPGWNRDARFDGKERSWKSEASEWRFDGAWAGLGQVQELALLFYDAPDEPGVYLDRIRLDGVAAKPNP